MAWSCLHGGGYLHHGIELLTALALFLGVLLVLLASCIACLIYVVYLMQLRTKHYMEKFPGRPTNLPLLKTWLAHRYLSKQAHLVDYSVMLFQLTNGASVAFRKEGMVRFYAAAQPTLALFKAEPIEDLLTNNVIIEKSSEYNMLKPWLGTGLLTSGGSKWRSRRKLLTPSFHFRTLDDFVGPINRQSMVFVDNLKKHAEVVNIVPLVTLCTLDIISETIMGYRLNAQNNRESDYVRAIQVVGEIFNRRMESPLYWIETIFRLSAAGKEFYRNLAVLHKFTRKVIAERKAEMEKKPVECQSSGYGEEDGGPRCKTRQLFLDILLKEHIKDPETFTEDDIREEVDTFMFEGHDTTAMGISWALYLIGLYPRHQELIHRELEDIFYDDRKRPITLEDSKKMKYLECCLKESQRLYPSVPFIARTCSEAAEIAGRTVPKGTTVHVSIYNLHRDSEVFPKPEEFIPDRFLPENTVGRHPFAYIPFSAGPRNCVGQRFAMMEEKIVVANVLRNYRLFSQRQRDEVLLVAEMVLRPKNGLWMKFVPK